MKLVVGLGNPGEQYRETRHNIGFEVVKRLWQDSDHPTSFETDCQGLVTHVRIGDHDVLLLKPQTFMNRSGQAVSRALAKFEVDLEDLVVVHDDLDHPLGVVRIKHGGGSGGHRGLESCFTELGTRDFTRVRVGIGRPPAGGDAVEYVLEEFEQEQRGMLDEVVGLAADATLETIRDGAAHAMNRFNRRLANGGER